MTDEPPVPVDHAVEIATKRTKSAERDYLDADVTEEEAIVRADKVERRAEDLTELAGDAARRRATRADSAFVRSRRNPAPAAARISG